MKEIEMERARSRNVKWCCMVQPKCNARKGGSLKKQEWEVGEQVKRGRIF